MKKLILLLFLPTMAIAQNVGIGTTAPEARLHVKGDIIVEQLELGTIYDTLVVVRNGRFYKVPASFYQTVPPPTNCPILVANQSNGYYLLFKSTTPIVNPNASLVIQNKVFQPAGNWTQGNTYFYSYTNTSGNALNINQPFSVNFTGQICNY